MMKLTLFGALLYATISSANATHSLFDGSNLDQFNKVGDANWQVAEKNAEANQGNGFLVTKESFSTFTLSLEFYADKETNSGVFFRCSHPTAIDDKKCYEMNIFDSRPDQTYRTGSIVNIAPPLKKVDTEQRWNKLEIQVESQRFTVRINGEKTVDTSLAPVLKEGPIALQFAKGGIKFRNVKLAKIIGSDLKTEENIQGVWKLTGFEIEDAKGNVTPWCKGAHGFIFYTKHHMSVAINCTTDASKKVFYSGPYHLEDATVIHEVKNYGDESLNKTFRRQVSMPDEDHLVLSGALSDGGQARILWERASD